MALYSAFWQESAVTVAVVLTVVTSRQHAVQWSKRADDRALVGVHMNMQHWAILGSASAAVLATALAWSNDAQANAEASPPLVTLAPESLHPDKLLSLQVPPGEIKAQGARLVEDYPCKGCLFQVPEGYDPKVPAPLWIALHGDEGNPRYTHSAHVDAMNNAGYLLVSLQCPTELGCNTETPTWYDWAEQDTHDPQWVNKQREAIEKDYNVDPARMYLSGFSAGSMYLSFWALDNSELYAGVIYETCGHYGHSDECTAPCKIPAYFLEGSEDFCLNQGEAQMEYMKACMHELVWDVVEGEDHKIISDKLPTVLDWAKEHPLNCGDDDDDDTSSSGEDSSDSDSSADDSTSSSDDTSSSEDNDDDDGDDDDDDGDDESSEDTDPDGDSTDDSADTTDESDNSDDGDDDDDDDSSSNTSTADEETDGGEEDGSSDDSGCACSTPGQGDGFPQGAAALAGLAWLGWRRRASRS